MEEPPQTLRGRQEADLGGCVEGPGEEVGLEGDGQLRVEQLQTLLLGCQGEDLVLEALVLLLQGVQRLEHLHNWNGGDDMSNYFIT